MNSSELRIENAELRKASSHSQFSILNSAFHLLLFLAAIGLYTFTLNGDVQPADSGEFQIAAISLGIPHPPGYPLFTVLGWLFSLAPIGSPFARVSFLSVVTSAATLVLVSLTVQFALDKGARRRGDRERRLVGVSLSPSRLASVSDTLAGIAAALVLGTSTTFWAQATTTNIRSLTAFFTALMLFASAVAYKDARPSSLVLFALAFGLGIGHHVSLIFVGIVLGAFVLWQVWRATVDKMSVIRELLIATLVFLATQLVWLYLLLRDAAGGRFAPGNLTTLEGLLFHVFARGFVGDMLAFAAPEFLFDRLALVPTLLNFQFSLAVLMLMVVAWIALLLRRTAFAVALLIAFVLHLFITITYRAPQTVEYAMPAWVIACVVLGAGMGVIGYWLSAIGDRAPTNGRLSSVVYRLSSVVVIGLVFALALRDAIVRLPSYVLLSRDDSTRERAEAVLRAAQTGDVILAQWHQATPMWALQDIEGLQRDVRVEYVYPRGAQLYPETFADRVADSVKDRPTLITSLFEPQFAMQNLRALPLADTPAWRIQTQRVSETPRVSDLLFDNRIGVIVPIGIDGDTVEVGQAVSIDLGWFTQGSHRSGDSITARILHRDGRLAANADVRIPEGQPLNETHFKRIMLGIPWDLPPGEYGVYIGAYRADTGHADGFMQYGDKQGREFVPAATLHVTPASQPPATQRPKGDKPFGQTGEKPRLIGVDYDTGIPDKLRVWMHWQLGSTAQTITLQGMNGKPVAEPREISAATVLTQPQFLSVVFDIPPMQGLQLAIGGVNERLPVYVDGERYVPFANQMAFIGSNTRREGESLKADLHWLSARPITDDYIVSARVEGNGIYKTHDSVPALGTLPTLKWIRGSRIMDRHPLNLGDYRGDLKGTVVVYDSVSQLPLPALDERYERGITFPIE